MIRKLLKCLFNKKLKPSFPITQIGFFTLYYQFMLNKLVIIILSFLSFVALFFGFKKQLTEQEIIKAHQKKYRELNKDQKTEASRKWREKNKDYGKKNKIRIYETKKQWLQKKQEKINLANQ